jgi:hypothetical protein
MFKYNAGMLKKIEDIFKEGGYTVRYEKGNFQNGYCILEKRRVAVINKFHEIDAKINSMMEMLTHISDLELGALSSESTTLYREIMASKGETLFENHGE